MKKIKVLHIIPSLSSGGAEKMAALLAGFSNPEIFSSEILCLRAGGFWEADLKKRGVPVRIAGSLRRPIILDFFKIIGAIKSAAPDIVHTHLFGADFYGRLAARLAGVKKIISTEHNVNLSEGVFRKILKRLTSSLALKIVAVSAAIKEHMIKTEWLPAEKIEVIPNGVETEKFPFFDRDYNPAGRPLIIGSIGRLTKQKGFDCLLEALAGIKDIKCLIAGAGEEKESLENNIKRLGLEKRAELVGLQKDIPRFLQSLDVFVLPSRWEGFGIVLLEAGLSGLPVIASRTGGIPEIIDAGQNGWLFAPGDVVDLSAKLLETLSEAGERARRGRALREKVFAEFDIRKTVKRYEELYLKITK